MSGSNKGDDFLSGAQKGGAHPHHRKRHKERPCPEPPAAPENVTLHFRNNGTRVHPDYSGRIAWDGVFTDETGRKIPGQGVEIDHYQGQYVPCDVGGNIVEIDGEDARVRRFHIKSVKGVKVTNATNASGTIGVYTTKKAHGFVSGETVRVQDVKPGGYNGKFTVDTTPTTTSFTVANIGTSGLADLQDQGTVEGEPDPNYHYVFEKVPHPKRWLWKARVRAWDNKNCPSDWSAWTDPTTVTNNTPPPAPENVLIFDRSTNRVVMDWDDPIGWEDIDGTVSATSGGSTLTGTGTQFKQDLADAQGVGLPGVQIKVGTEIFDVASISSATSLTIDGTWVSNHTDVKCSVEERDPDIHHYHAQLSKADDTFDHANIYRRDRKHQRSRIAWRVANADQGQVYYGRVRSVDHEGLVSPWIPATLTGNSDPTTTPDGVLVGAAGKTKLPFSFFGKIRVLSESQVHDIEMDEGLTLEKMRARVKQAPTGDDIIIHAFKNGTVCGTVTINDGDRFGRNSAMSVSFADEDALSLDISQVGSTFPGKHLTVVCVLL